MTIVFDSKNVGFVIEHELRGKKWHNATDLVNSFTMILEK